MSMPMDPVPDLATMSWAKIAHAVGGRQSPPVNAWTPERCGDSGMRIARDGTWWHDGAPIARADMVRLFSTLLRREPDGRHVLVTPVELLDIVVEDAPFLAVELRQEGDGRDARLIFRLNTGDIVLAGARHRLHMVDGAGGTRPYLHVRRGLEALLTRPLYYELIELALAGVDDPPGVWSDGAFFAVEAAA